MNYNKKQILEIFQKEDTIAQTARTYCKLNNQPYNDSIRRAISNIINKEGVKESPDEGFENETDTKTNQYSNDVEGAETDFFMPSAWDTEKNRFLSIDEYCDKYGLPKDQVRSSKLVAHLEKHMIYNIAFNPTLNEQTGIDEDFIEGVIKKHIQPVEGFHYKRDAKTSIITNLTYTDTHIGLDPNKDNNSLYGGVWDKSSLIDRMKAIVAHTVNKSVANESEILYIRDLGDLADGLDGQTVRGGHELPQNMNNTEVFDTAIEFKVSMIDFFIATGQYSQIICENVCNSNHGGDFDYFINSAFKHIVETKYPNVTVNNHRKFISHYGVGNHCFVISHGKDDKTLKFGFKPVLDTKAIEKIDQYIKGNGLYNKYKYFHFCKGDSHQFLLDFTTSQDFNYFNYPALSPASQWVQNNFKKGMSGFVVEIFDAHAEEIDISYKKFNWIE